MTLRNSSKQRNIHVRVLYHEGPIGIRFNMSPQYPLLLCRGGGGQSDEIAKSEDPYFQSRRDTVIPIGGHRSRA